MGYSFAIPSAIVKKVVVDLKEYGVVQRALLGVSYREIDEEFVEAFGEEYGIRETGGVYVADVSEDGAAKAAGIRKGDVITAIDGIRLGNNTNLAEIMSRYRPNDKVTISVKGTGKRNNSRLCCVIRLVRPNCSPATMWMWPSRSADVSRRLTTEPAES